MNANELADELENTDEGSGYLGVLSLEAATMLRQQQAEIDRLFKAHSVEMVRADTLQIELAEASGMIGVLREYIYDLENGLKSSIHLNKAQAGRTQET